MLDIFYAKTVQLVSCLFGIGIKLESVKADPWLSQNFRQLVYKVPEVKVRVGEPTSKLPKVLPFNYDRAYKLDAVED